MFPTGFSQQRACGNRTLPGFPEGRDWAVFTARLYGISEGPFWKGLIVRDGEGRGLNLEAFWGNGSMRGGFGRVVHVLRVRNFISGFGKRVQSPPFSPSLFAKWAFF